MGSIVFELNRAVVQSGYNPFSKPLYRNISGSRKQLDTPVRPMQAFKCKPILSSAAHKLIIVEDHKQFTIYTLIGITNAFSVATRRNALLTPFLPRLLFISVL